MMAGAVDKELGAAIQPGVGPGEDQDNEHLHTETQLSHPLHLAVVLAVDLDQWTAAVTVVEDVEVFGAARIPPTEMLVQTAGSTAMDQTVVAVAVADGEDLEDAVVEAVTAAVEAAVVAAAVAVGGAVRLVGAVHGGRERGEGGVDHVCIVE